jgi:dipeptidyl aminopeptidase/acylaminoacyl peptidase
VRNAIAVVASGTVVAMVTTVSAVGSDANAKAQRRLSIDDMFAVQEVRDVSFSPKGDSLAFTVVRPRKLPSAITEQDRAVMGDVWVQRYSAASPINITNGESDATGAWRPLWSPDGRRLAFLTTRQGWRTIHVWNTDLIQSRLCISGMVTSDQGFGWLGPTKLVAQLESAKTPAERYGGFPLVPDRDNVTALTFHAGERVRESLSHDRLVVYDCDTDTLSTVAEDISAFWISASGNYLAVISADQVDSPTATTPYSEIAYRREVLPIYKLLVLDGYSFRPAPIDIPSGVMPTTISWAPSGQKLACLVWRETERSVFVFRCDVSTKEVRMDPLSHSFTEGNRVSSAYRVQWGEDDSLIIGVLSGGAMPDGLGKAQYRYGQIDRLGRWSPGEVFRPTKAGLEQSAHPLAEELKPSAHANLVAHTKDGRTLAFKEHSRSGLRLWRVNDRGKSADLLVSLNQHLPKIAFATWRRIDYVSERGEPFIAWLLTSEPRSDRKLPLVVEVYPGRLYSAGSNAPVREGPLPQEQAIPQNNAWFRELLCSSGFAVLLPSMPAVHDGNWIASSKGVTDGVLPAIDRVVQLGIVAPDRIAVFGHSSGAYASLALAASTNRFTAVIAGAGPYNIGTVWGAFPMQERFADHGPIPAFRFSPEQDGEAHHHAGGHPWDRPADYWRRSPLYFADRIESPVFLYAGDIDGRVCMEESERMFAALWRLGKKAQFVRYLGEAHSVGIHSDRPANARHFLRTAVEWLDLHCNLVRDEMGDIVYDGRHVRNRSAGGAAASR